MTETKHGWVVCFCYRHGMKNIKHICRTKKIAQASCEESGYARVSELLYDKGTPGGVTWMRIEKASFINTVKDARPGTAASGAG